MAIGGSSATSAGGASPAESGGSHLPKLRQLPTALVVQCRRREPDAAVRSSGIALDEGVRGFAAIAGTLEAPSSLGLGCVDDVWLDAMPARPGLSPIAWSVGGMRELYQPRYPLLVGGEGGLTASWGRATQNGIWVVSTIPSVAGPSPLPPSVSSVCSCLPGEWSAAEPTR